MGGIRKAAKDLSIDHAVISRHIRSLETWLGMPLVIRHGPENLTEEGAQYYTQIAASLSIIANATGQLLKANEAQDRLNLSCIPGFGSLWLADRLNDFMQANPHVHVDFRPTDTSPEFRSSNTDVDIRYLRDWEVAGLPPNVRRQEVARPAVFPVASPSYVAAMPAIRTAADLRKCALIHENDDREWWHWLAAQGVEVPGELPGPRLWHANITLNAARAGQGIALANHMLLRDDLARGVLVEVKPREGAFEQVYFGGYTLLAREDRWSNPGIASFRNWLRKVATV